MIGDLNVWELRESVEAFVFLLEHKELNLLQDSIFLSFRVFKVGMSFPYFHNAFKFVGKVQVFYF